MKTSVVAGVGWAALTVLAELLRRAEMRAARRREGARLAAVRGRR